MTPRYLIEFDSAILTPLIITGGGFHGEVVNVDWGKFWPSIPYWILLACVEGYFVCFVFGTSLMYKLKRICNRSPSTGVLIWELNVYGENWLLRLRVEIEIDQCCFDDSRELTFRNECMVLLCVFSWAIVSPVFF